MQGTSIEPVPGEDSEEERVSARHYTVDGIKYDLIPKRTGATTTSYAVACDGTEFPTSRLVVVQHHGASAASRWVVLAAGGARMERDTVREMAETVARQIHG